MCNTHPDHSDARSSDYLDCLAESTPPYKSVSMLRRSTKTCPSLSAATWLSVGLEGSALIVTMYYGLPILRIARWTAVKDFHESCVSDRAIDVTSTACDISLAEPVHPPPVAKRNENVSLTMERLTLPTALGLLRFQGRCAARATESPESTETSRIFDEIGGMRRATDHIGESCRSLAMHVERSLSCYLRALEQDLVPGLGV